MKIALAYNVRHKKPGVDEHGIDDSEIDFDDPSTICGIKKAMEKKNHKVYLVEADENAYPRLKKLRDKIDLVFNYSEGFNGESRESHIPAMLELLNIPYVGPGPLASAIILNKAKTKEILKYHKIDTPRFQVFENGKEKLSESLRFPLIVKPVAEGSSKGIRNNSVVDNEAQLYSRIKEVIQVYKQPALVEEFIDGREFTVAVIGNDEPQVLPIIEVIFDDLPNHLKKFDSYEAKWIYDNPSKNSDPLVCPAKLDRMTERKIRDACLSAYKAVGCRDWTRIDLRLDKNSNPHIIELNCPPGIIPDVKDNSRFPRAAMAAGMSYDDMINKIISAAAKRYGIESNGKSIEQIKKTGRSQVKLQCRQAQYSGAHNIIPQSQEKQGVYAAQSTLSTHIVRLTKKLLTDG